MTNQEVAKKMLDKSFFKKSTGAGKGLLGFIDPSFKRYTASENHKVVPQVLLKYYEPESEGTDSGFGEYGIFACILNEKGEQELAGIKAQLQEKGLLDDIGNIRYESQDLRGCCLVDGFNRETVEEGELLIRQHSTDNVYVYVLTNDTGKKLEKVSQAVACMHPKLARNVYSINYKID
ncbi:hypothetical protein I2486_17390 [Cellulophaga sp. E16_2]|uniref:hypothetical protein n=1 Tax=Cellulophaga sp. E16_2 TaxID=2789297 RepID=UPI001A922E59|nr:hypothetical protein [Cellulophaga sp. E16_2]MBO0593180.1 hypothetical protein [Cellulophaga sp. E16_2]